MSTKSNTRLEDAEGIVISGISGAFPNCENVEEFKKQLFDGIDMISEVDRANKGK